MQPCPILVFPLVKVTTLMAICLSVAIGYLRLREVISATNDFVQLTYSVVRLCRLINGCESPTKSMKRTWPSLQLNFFPRPLGHDYFGASSATIFSKRESPRSGSQTGNNFNPP
jgi:hypothetical protein